MENCQALTPQNLALNIIFQKIQENKHTPAMFLTFLIPREHSHVRITQQMFCDETLEFFLF